MKSISEKDVEKAVDWLRDNADSCAKARATRIYLEEYRKLTTGYRDKKCALIASNNKKCWWIYQFLIGDACGNTEKLR